MARAEIRHIRTGTLIVGSGCAAYNAADWLWELGERDIALMTEGRETGTSRNTGSDKQTYYKLSLCGEEGDSVREMAKTLFDGGSVDGDTALCEAAASVRCFMKLVNYGVPFPTNEYGEYVGYKTDHDPRQRATSTGPLTSKLMTEALEKRVLEKGVRIYSGRVEALGSILNFLENQKEKYVVMSDANIAINYDFNALLAAHQASGADVTIAYQKTEIPEGRKNDNYTLTVDADGRVTELLFNDYRPGVQNLDLNIYVLERETLLKLVRDATSRGLIYFERDILAHNVNILNIHALEYTGYVAHVCDMKSYFDENLKLTDDENLEKLFPKKSPVYTKIRDDNPTRYVPGCKVTDSILADGCVIEGTVENCVLFRGVKVKKGAVVKNCVLMQDTVVEANAELDCVVTDKNVKITAGKKLSGTESFPVYVQKNHTV